VRKYAEADITDYFDAPVEPQYQVAPTTKPRDPAVADRIPTQDISNMKAPEMSSELSAKASNHLADLSQNTDLVDVPEEEDQSFSTEDEEEEVDETTAIATMPDNKLTTELAPSTWFTVSELPGNADQQIRALGKNVFSQFTTTSTDDMIAMSTLSNDEEEVKKNYAAIQKLGRKIKSVDLDFEQTMPGYQAEGEIWRAKGYEFLLVKDEFGYYVYGWLENESKMVDVNPVKGYLEATITLHPVESPISIFKEWING